jgi:uncharacterized oligopeptide transporter (OPT) family protein
VWKTMRMAGQRSNRTSVQGRLPGIGLTVAALGVVGLSWAFFGLHPALGLAALVASFVLIDVCVRTAGETDIAPMGPLGQLVQLVTGLLAPGMAAANVAAASITAGAGAQSALATNTFKTGQVLGARPAAQLIAQLAGAVVGVAIALPAYWLFKAAYQLGDANLPAPGALGWKALATLAETGSTAMPRGTVIACVIAALAGIVIALLERSSLSRFVPSPMALAVAFLVPATTAATFALGAGLSFLVGQRFSAAGPRASSMAAGAIAGEAVIGLMVAIMLATGLLG